MSIESKIPTEEINVKDLNINSENLSREFHFDPETEFGPRDWASVKRSFDEYRKANNYSMVLFFAGKEKFFRGEKAEIQMSEQDWDLAMKDVENTWTKVSISSALQKFSGVSMANNINILDPERFKQIPFEGFDFKKWWTGTRHQYLYSIPNTLTQAETFRLGLDLKTLYPDMQPFDPQDSTVAKQVLYQLLSGKPQKNIVKGREMHLGCELLSNIKVFFPEDYARIDHKIKSQVAEYLRHQFDSEKKAGATFPMLNTAEQMAILSAENVNFGPRGMELYNPNKALKTPPVPDSKKF